MAAKLARFSWLPGGFTAALVIVAGRLMGTTSTAPLELPVYDRMVSAADLSASKDLVLITIDEASTAKLGSYPWPLDVHASLIDRLHADGARVVAFTEPLTSTQRTGVTDNERLRAALALLESSNLGNSDQAQQLRRLLGESQSILSTEARLAQAMSTHGNVVMAVAVSPGPGGADSPVVLPKELMANGTAAVMSNALTAHTTQAIAGSISSAAHAVGHVYKSPDADGVLRTELAAVRIEDSLLPSLATAVVARARNVQPTHISFEATHSLHIGEHAQPLEPGLKVRPHYFPIEGPRSFVRYSYWQVLAGEVPREQLRDKIVLIGQTDGNTADLATATAARMTPLHIAASSIASLLGDVDYTRTLLPAALEWAVAAAVILFAAFVLPHTPLLLGGAATLLIAGMLVMGEFGLLHSAQTWARFMLPSLALLIGFAMYGLGEFIRRANTRTGGNSKDPTGNLRALGQTFQKQGQLDLAFETYRRCPLDAATMELLYVLGMDFERRRQMQKADAVYGYIAGRDPNYRDLRARRARVQETSTNARDGLPTEPPRKTAVPMRRPDSEDLEATIPARTLGRYEIERELGKGAMGVVYLGRDPKINRVVAIKAIPLAEEFEEDDLAEARARFFREAEMAGRLNHPAIVTVYDAGEDQGLAYIAMEYLRGHHLSHHTDPSRLLPPRKAMLLAARVADALHYAHRQNVVHRDIKPANIMYNPDTDELKITDFGIARLTDTSRTKTGIVLGTPSFMSPEQLEGRNLDGRSDQFALGVSLFQLLCGHLPFRAESMPRLMQKIATEPHASVRLVRPELPECIDAILDRTLAKPADDRYATCAELAVALRECAGGEEQKAPAQSKHEWLIP